MRIHGYISVWSDFIHVVVFCMSAIIDSSMCKKKRKKKKRKKKEKKVIYIFHYIILHGARVCTRHLVTLSIYDGESLYVSSPLSHMCDI